MYVICLAKSYRISVASPWEVEKFINYLYALPLKNLQLYRNHAHVNVDFHISLASSFPKCFFFVNVQKFLAYCDNLHDYYRK